MLLECLCLLRSLHGSPAQLNSVRIGGFWEAVTYEKQTPLFFFQSSQQHKENHYSAKAPIHWYEQKFYKRRTYASLWEILKGCWVFYAHWEMDRGHQTHFTKAATNPPVSKTLQSPTAGFELATAANPSALSPSSPSFYGQQVCVCVGETVLSHLICCRWFMAQYQLGRLHKAGGQEGQLHHLPCPPVQHSPLSFTRTPVY